MLKCRMHSRKVILCCRNKKSGRANTTLQSCFPRWQPGSRHDPFYLQICKLLTDNEEVGNTL